MNLKQPGVYCIKNTWSEKLYVGSSRNVEARVKRHLRMLRNGTHHSPKLQNAWNHDGENVFEVGILIMCPADELLSREQEFIVSFDAVNSGYNISKHASSPMRGRKQTEETLTKMRESHKNRKPISEETRQLMREASIAREVAKKESGFKVSDETKAKLVAKLTGRPVSEETRAKMSANHKGQTLTSEQREKQIAALTGRTLSEEHKAAITAGNLKRWAAVRGEKE